MRIVFDLLYLIAAVVTSPVWLPRMILTGKIRTDWPGRFGRVRGPVREDEHRPRILIHAVSVGEVNATRQLVDHLLADPRHPRIMISSTTDTGVSRAKALFAKECDVVRFPFDFSPFVRRFLNSVKPDVVALVELEVWPNFTAICAGRTIPVCVINGRLSERSAKRYRLIRRLVQRSFRLLSFAAVQNDDYAARFKVMGVPPERIHTSDTMKWDTAVITDDVPGADELADALGIDRTRPLVVAGSTAPGEHALLHIAVPDGVQLLCAPRKPEWCQDAMDALDGCAVRSKGDRGSASGRFLLDTIGELRHAYALADVVVVGRSFAPYGGSDMMEPVGLGKATIIGPHVENFRDMASALLAGGGLVQTDAEALPRILEALLDDPVRRCELAEHGRGVIRSRQGASRRNAELILSLVSLASWAKT